MARRGGAGAQQLVDVGGVTVVVDGERRARQPSPVDERGVVELVGAHEGVGAGEGAEHPEVGGEPGAEEDRGVGPLPGRQLGLELVVHRSGADDEACRAGTGAPPVDGRVRGGTHRGVLGEPEVVVRRERHQRVRVRRVERAGCPPLTCGLDARRLAVGPVAPVAPSAPVAPAVGSGRHATTSSSASVSACTMRCSSADVTVSGGISTTTSPSGRSSTPRSTARRAHPPAPSHALVWWGQLDAAHEPAQAHLGDRGMRARRGRRAAPRNSSERARTVSEHRPRVEQLEVPERHRGRQRVPRVRMPVVQRALGEVGAEEGVEHRPPGHGRRHRQVAGGEALAHHEQVGSEVALLRGEQACRCARTRWRPRRR